MVYAYNYLAGGATTHTLAGITQKTLRSLL
jgi:hypothetical protein